MTVYVFGREMCDCHGFCRRRGGHRGCHTPAPPVMTQEWDDDRDGIAARIVCQGLRAGRIDADAVHARRWLARAAGRLAA